MAVLLPVGATEREWQTMGATRFYLTNAGASEVNPSFDAGWEQNGQADRVIWIPKPQTKALQTLADGTAITVPITTTQDYLCRQFVSQPIPPQDILGTF